MVLIFLAPSAFASDSPCHYPIKRSQNLPNHGEVTCLSCKTLDDYSMYGAAHMVNSGGKYKSMTVKNAYGDKRVFVASNAHIVSRGISINLGPFINWDFNRNDRSHQAISSYVQRGSVSGKPWYKHPVPNSAAVAKCKAIPDEENEAAQEGNQLERQRERQALYESISSRGHRPNSAEIAFLTGQSPYLYLRGDRDGPPPPCHGINGNSGTRCYRR